MKPHRPNPSRTPGIVYAHEDQCCARWWDGRRIVACQERVEQDRSEDGYRRCATHAPDGCALSPLGQPIVEVLH